MNRPTKDRLEELVDGLLRGKQENLQEIAELLFGAVYSFFVFRMRLPEADAPDVESKFVQDLFDKKIWQYKARPESTFWSWLCAAMSSTAKDWRRAHKKDPEPLDPDAQVIDPRSEILDEFPPSPERQGILDAFDDAFCLLGEDERDAMRLKLVAEEDYAQMVEDTNPGIADKERARLVNRLKVRVHRAKAKVWNAMKADSRVPRRFFESEK